MHIIVICNFEFMTSMTNKAPTALWPRARPVCILLRNLRHIYLNRCMQWPIGNMSALPDALCN
jgi:hypothetical protein